MEWFHSSGLINSNRIVKNSALNKNDLIPVDWFNFFNFSHHELDPWMVGDIRRGPARGPLVLEWFHSSGMISFQWNDFLPVEWFYSSGMISFQWNDFIPVEWFHCSVAMWNSQYCIEEKTFRDEEGMDMMELTDVFFLMLFGLFVRAKNNLKLLVSLWLAGTWQHNLR